MNSVNWVIYFDYISLYKHNINRQNIYIHPVSMNILVLV